MHKFQDIIKMTDEQLIDNHNTMTNYSYGGGFFIEEYYRRQHEKSTKTIEKMNMQMLRFTKGITILTIINVIAVLIALFK